MTLIKRTGLVLACAALLGIAFNMAIDSGIFLDEAMTALAISPSQIPHIACEKIVGHVPGSIFEMHCFAQR